MEYPKIETLFNRNEKFKVIEGEYRCPEFEMIDRWYITEKIHGDNTRITINSGSLSNPKLQGRHDKSDLKPKLVEYFNHTFTFNKIAKTFPDLTFPNLASETDGQVVLFGESYGPTIQKGGNYRKDVSLRLFDVWVKDEEHIMGGWWLEPENVEDIATKLDIQTAPVLPFMTTREAVEYVKARKHSIVSSLDGGNPDYIMEGIVARTKPLLFTRRGDRLMWKLKSKDFPRSEV